EPLQALLLRNEAFEEVANGGIGVSVTTFNRKLPNVGGSLGVEKINKVKRSAWCRKQTGKVSIRPLRIAVRSYRKGNPCFHFVDPHFLSGLPRGIIGCRFKRCDPVVNQLCPAGIDDARPKLRHPPVA